MALSISEASNRSYYDYGDTNYPVFTMSGSSAQLPYWESAFGSFSDKFATTTTFTPSNKYALANIKARRVISLAPGAFGFNQISYTPVGGVVVNIFKSVGGNAWDSAAFLTGVNGASASENYFIEISADEITKEKALITSNTLSSADPTNGTSDFSWHFLTNGIVVGRKSGLVVTPEIQYNVGDVFRLERTGSTMYFKVNGVTVLATPTIPTNPMNQIFSIKTLGGVFGRPTHWKSSTEDVANYNLQINAQFPEQPNYSYEINLENKTLASYAEDGSAVYRIKGGIKRVWSLSFTERPYNEYKTVYDFWMYHQKHIKFYYNDIVYGIKKYVTFDTGLRVQTVGPDRITFSCVVKEV